MTRQTIPDFGFRIHRTGGPRSRRPVRRSPDDREAFAGRVENGILQVKMLPYAFNIPLEAWERPQRDPRPSGTTGDYPKKRFFFFGACALMADGPGNPGGSHIRACVSVGLYSHKHERVEAFTPRPAEDGAARRGRSRSCTGRWRGQRGDPPDVVPVAAVGPPERPSGVLLPTVEFVRLVDRPRRQRGDAVRIGPARFRCLQPVRQVTEDPGCAGGCRRRRSPATRRTAGGA